MSLIKCCVANCKDYFDNLSSYRVHLNIIHALNNNQSFKCTIEQCNKQFLIKKSLFDHLKKIHKYPQNNKSVVSVLKSKENENNNLEERNKPSQQFIIHDVITDSQSTIETTQPDIINNEHNDALIQKQLEKTFVDFLMDLHGNSDLTKEMINKIFYKVKIEIVDKILAIVEAKNSIKKSVDNAFDKYNSQYKFEKHLIQNGYLVNGDDQVISYKIGNMYKNGMSILAEIKETVCLMPIKKMIKDIFELPNILNDVTSYMHELTFENSITNIVNGTRWKNIIKNYPETAIVIPYDLYTDDFETGNALGSNAGTHKITAYYLSFPTFPQHLRSTTEYIFEVLLHPARLKYDEFECCLERLIEVFKELEEEGIIMNINGEQTKVYFALARIVGDNLALNEILGFSRSFNALKFCRICKLNKNETKLNIIPSASDLRSLDEYEMDKLKNDFHETGIRQECIFNTLSNFHCTENLVFDIMHDLYEGIVKYDVALILKEFINDKSLKDVNLDKINLIKQNFNYGKIEIGNLSLPITEKHIKLCSLKMSASEMKTFLHFLPLMLGNLIPSTNKFWKLLLNLVEISDLVMSSCFEDSSVQKLKSSINNYTNSYRQIFGDTLRPKHHFILHYADCIEYNGPLRYMMTFSYEMKNKVVKSYANVCNQRKNLSKSLSYKVAMRFNNFIRTHQNGFGEIINHQKTLLHDWEDFTDMEYFNDIDLSIFLNKEVFKCKKITFKRTTYEIGFFIIDSILTPQTLMEIIDIFYVEKEYYLITELYSIEKFDHHLSSYKVGSSEKKYKLMLAKEIVSLPFNLHKISNQKYFRIKLI